MTNLVKTKKICTGLLIVGIVLVILGLVLYLQSNVLGAVLLMIAGLSVAIISKTVLKLISLYSFNYALEHARKHRNEKQE